MAKIRKVVDPAKIVTDQSVLDCLAAQGIDKDYVEFNQDYALRGVGKAPHVKTYRDLKTNKHIAIIGNSPKINARGEKCGKSVVGWAWDGAKYITTPNQFSATVDDRKLRIELINDQVDGYKEGDSVETTPDLYLDGKAVSPTSVQAFVADDVDPVGLGNPNYHNNILWWDYGICIRRIRVIEGRIRDRFVFASNPKGSIRIAYNHSGVIDLLPSFAVTQDSLNIPLEVTARKNLDVAVSVLEFTNALYPVEVR